MKEEFTREELKKFRQEYASGLTEIHQSNEDNKYFEVIKWTLDKAFAEFIFALQKLYDGKFETSKECEKVEE